MLYVCINKINLIAVLRIDELRNKGRSKEISWESLLIVQGKIDGD